MRDFLGMDAKEQIGEFTLSERMNQLYTGSFRRESIRSHRITFNSDMLTSVYYWRLLIMALMLIFIPAAVPNVKSKALFLRLISAVIVGSA